MPVNPSPSRQFVLSSVTPKVADVLFYVVWDKSRASIPEYGTPHPNDTLFPDHLLCHYETIDDQGDKLRLWYIAPRENQDEYNWESAKADIGGTRFDAVERTYVTLRSPIRVPSGYLPSYNPESPAMGDTMPDVPKGLFSGDFVLAERKCVRSDDQKIDSLFVIEKRVYVKRSTITENQFDDVCRRNLPVVQTLYYASEIVTGSLTAAQLFDDPGNAYWGMQDEGVVREGKQLSTEWFAVTERRVVAGTFVDGVVLIDSYTTNKNYSWPPVLSEVEFMDWERKDGGTDIFPRVVYNPKEYSGPCKALVSVTWAASPFTIAKVDQMLPTSVHYSSPFFSLNTDSCLHGAVVSRCDIGNTDPDYAQNAGSSRTTAATNHVVWPSSIRAYDEQQPFRGGYLRTVITIDKPA